MAHLVQVCHCAISLRCARRTKRAERDGEPADRLQGTLSCSFARTPNDRHISLEDLSNTEVDAQQGKQLLIVKCSTCHIVKDILIRKSPGEWETTVNRMVKLAAPQITPGEARQIIYFLSTEYGTGKNGPVRSTAAPEQ